MTSRIDISAIGRATVGSCAAMDDVLARVRVRRPYFARALAAMTPCSAPGLGTFAVDRHWRIYYDPAVLGDWGLLPASGVVVHEILHLISKHTQRALALGQIDPQVWILAADCEINDDEGLFGTDCPHPEDEDGNPALVYPSTFGLEDHLLAEDYYARLMSMAVSAVQGCGGGSGVDGVEQPWEIGEPSDGAPGLDEVAARATRAAVAEAVRNYAKGKGRDNTPVSLLRWADAELGIAKISWQSALATQIRHSVAQAAGRVDYTYGRLSRRQGCRDVKLPAMFRPIPKVAVVVDTSGSMGDDDISAAVAEVGGICRATGTAIEFFSCDTEASYRRIHTAREAAANMVGGGGTDMGMGIAAAALKRPTVIVVITDGDTDWPEDPGIRVLVVLVRPTTCPTPSYAKVLHAFDDEDGEGGEP